VRAIVDNFGHFLQWSDGCPTQNCPELLAVTKTKDGTKAWLYVRLRVKKSTGAVVSDRNNLCYGAGKCSAKRLQWSSGIRKHDRSYTFIGDSFHACGTTDWDNGESCYYYSDDGAYDATSPVHIPEVAAFGHVHRLTGL
jgi:hypothetical protein